MQQSNDELEGIRTPRRGFAPLSGLLTGRAVPGFVARLGIAAARRRGRPWRLFGRVIAARHADIAEALSRDLDFRIAPVNGAKIEEVNGPFILGMDRSPVHQNERRALYAALSHVDFAEIGSRIEQQATGALAREAGDFDAITDYARPVAVATAMHLFGISSRNPAVVAEVARAIFAHTFLNLGNDEKVRARALKAEPLLKEWLGSEIARRRASGATGTDLMGRLLEQHEILDDTAVRRTLGGMLVGSIDTTVAAFAKILCVLRSDDDLAAAFAEAMAANTDLFGLCLEALRRWPHNPILLRIAQADTNLAGTPVRAGDSVVLWTQAAMLDVGAFPEPSRAVVDRPLPSYLHFGGGLHPCAGRRLNAIQLPILLRLILPRLTGRTGRIQWAGPFPDKLSVRLKGLP